MTENNKKDNGFEKPVKVGETIEIKQDTDKIKISKQLLKIQGENVPYICVKKYKLDDEGESRGNAKQFWFKVAQKDKIIDAIHKAAEMKETKK